MVVKKVVGPDYSRSCHYLVDTAGLDRVLLFGPGPWMCGSIKDGVGLEVPELIEGGFVIAYEDLIQMVEIAKQARTGEGPLDE